MAADVANEADVQAAIDTAQQLAPLRVVVNCAGIATAGRIRTRRTLDLGAFERTIRVNLIGTFNVTRLAAAAMAATEPVAVLGAGRARHGRTRRHHHTASVAAFDGQIGQAAYAGVEGRRRRR